MKKKKVLFVINTLGHAGAEVALLELLGRLEGTNLELSVYVLTDQGELADDLPPGVKLLNQRYCRSSVLSGEEKGAEQLLYKNVRPEKPALSDPKRRENDRQEKTAGG